MTEQQNGRPAERFDYVKPTFSGGKAIVRLAVTENATFAVQVVRRGGETNLHSHPHLDGFWFVLAGRARFYTIHDEVIAEPGPQQGVLIPKGYPYWFESTGDDDLEILQLEASDIPMATVKHFAADRIDHRPRTAMESVVLESAR